MSGAEQRRSQRKPIELHASVSSESGGAQNTIAVHTVNLSSKGALIEAADKLFPEEVCTFKFVMDDARVVEVQGRIAWVTQPTPGVFHAGVAFRNVPVDEQYLLDLQIARSGRSKS